jgi:hypothetical protein
MSEEKKIIVDEDWKSQVQAEKEALEHQKTPQPRSPDHNGADPQMPPASFEMLLSTLATEAMMSLGQLPHPVTGQMVYQPNQAKYLIDTIEVLQQKTNGNLSPLEETGIENLLHQLRMAYLAGPPEADPQEMPSVDELPYR